jgi:CRISPR-associated endonuclease/helicase Cas3
METILPSSELLSHPDKKLEEHLIGVAKLCMLFLEDKPPSIKTKLKEVILLAALFHDIGKSTSYFQDYIRNPSSSKSEKSQHSLLSAIIGLIFSSHLMDVWNSFIVYYLIRHHHSNFSNPMDSLAIDDDDVELLREQLSSIDEEKFNIVLKHIASYYADIEKILPKISKNILLNVLNHLSESVLDFRRKIRRILADERSVHNYLLINLASSILLDADKSDVVVNDYNFFLKRYKFSGDLVDSYFQKITFRESKINHLRSQAYCEVINSINEISDNRIFAINLPTGLGKTFASFSFALKLRELLGNYHRIIYCLPFLSIIDQNYNEIYKVLQENNIYTSSEILLKHHHLSEISFSTTNAQKEFESDVARILIEGWNSEIIVTTFVQLFNTLITNSNRSVRKFHRLANSIIILDEVQAIPIKYWELVNELLKYIANELNSYILLVTATQPLIFGKNEVHNLCKGEFYIQNLQRIKLFSWLESQSIEEYIEKFSPGNKRYLFILNTINSAKKFYNLLKVKVENITFLSSHILPCERLKRIKEIKDGHYDFVVSTQLVEAGVDIDFDVVVRDIAPLDSIIQSAGRCNRNGKEKGEVHLLSFVENGKALSSYIYDPVLLNITKSILSEKREYEESDIYALSLKYFEKTLSAKSQFEAQKILEAITDLKYKSQDETISISDFVLINDGYQRIDVFIEINEEAKSIWNKFMEIQEINDRFERKKTFDQIKAKFYEYVISVPKNIPNRPEVLFEDLGYVPYESLDIYYDKETGFKVKEEQSVIIL